MRKSFLLFLLIGFSQLLVAQYTDIINSNRPGFSVSPFGIGSGVYQVEGGFFFERAQIKSRFSNPQSFGANMSFRYSYFNEKLEFNLDLTYANDRLAFKNLHTSYKNISGLSQVTIGAKYLLYQREYDDKYKEVRSWKKRMAFDKKRLTPSVGAYFGINTPVASGDFHEGISPKIAIYLQNDLTDRYVILTNIILDKLGTPHASYTYILSETYTINDKYSIFLENLGRYHVNFNNEFQVAGGLAYLKTKDLQLDASLRLFFEGPALGAYVGFGASWRIDKHLEKVNKQSQIEAVDKLLIDKNRDKDEVSKKKRALQHLYRQTKSIRKIKKIKETTQVKKTTRKVRAIKKDKPKKVKKAWFSKRVKRDKSDQNDNQQPDKND